LVPKYKVDSPYSRIKKDIIISRIKSFISDDYNKEVLQLGCSNGYETDRLMELFGKLDVVDGSLSFITKLMSETDNPKLKFIYSLFEEIASVVKDKKYDIIVCNYVLEHVSNPVLILMELKKILKDVGIIFVVVPNSTALSRQIALNMNYLDNLTDLTENDLNHGHRRVYNKTSIEKDILLSGMEIVKSEGIIFKILADFQLNKLLDENMLSESHINALQKLAMNEGNKQFSDSLFYVLKRS
jgi:2-polyprenyl-3-methyl-5-hydroxy-6-metoxy-1,4-benzoquinol methylase